MAIFDVFNGDADGLCALHQWRLAHPLDAARSHLVTGVKRDVALLARVEAHAGDQINVFDISLDANRDAITRLLDAGVAIRYFDHHYDGGGLVHAGLDATIDTSPRVCTSILVDRALSGRYRRWAITAAFGDNLAASAHELADLEGIGEDDRQALAELGDCLNYNAYGETLADLHFHPRVLYEALRGYENPLAFAEQSTVYAVLHAGLHADIARSATLTPRWSSDHGVVYLLPDRSWARRISGVFANRVASASPNLAHAIISLNAAGSYRVSVRAPLANPKGADALARRFPGGGGRQAAAGIDALPAADLNLFLELFGNSFTPASAAA